jgi:hypothetical protein
VCRMQVRWEGLKSQLVPDSGQSFNGHWARDDGAPVEARHHSSRRTSLKLVPGA